MRRRTMAMIGSAAALLVVGGLLIALTRSDGPDNDVTIRPVSAGSSVATRVGPTRVDATTTSTTTGGTTASLNATGDSAASAASGPGGPESLSSTNVAGTLHIASPNIGLCAYDPNEAVLTLTNITDHVVQVSSATYIGFAFGADPNLANGAVPMTLESGADLAPGASVRLTADADCPLLGSPPEGAIQAVAGYTDATGNHAFANVPTVPVMAVELPGPTADDLAGSLSLDTFEEYYGLALHVGADITNVSDHEIWLFYGEYLVTPVILCENVDDPTKYGTHSFGYIQTEPLSSGESLRLDWTASTSTYGTGTIACRAVVTGGRTDDGRLEIAREVPAIAAATVTIPA